MELKQRLILTLFLIFISCQLSAMQHGSVNEELANIYQIGEEFIQACGILRQSPLFLRQAAHQSDQQLIASLNRCCSPLDKKNKNKKWAAKVILRYLRNRKN